MLTNGLPTDMEDCRLRCMTHCWSLRQQDGGYLLNDKLLNLLIEMSWISGKSAGLREEHDRWGFLGVAETEVNRVFVHRAIHSHAALLAACKDQAALLETFHEALTGGGILTAQSVLLGPNKQYRTLARDIAANARAAIRLAEPHPEASEP